MLSFGYNVLVITLNGSALKVMSSFVYLGSSISGDSIASSNEVECRIGKAPGVFARLKECVWKRRNISLTTKMKIFNAVVITTLLYSSDVNPWPWGQILWPWPCNKLALALKIWPWPKNQGHCQSHRNAFYVHPPVQLLLSGFFSQSGLLIRPRLKWATLSSNHWSSSNAT